MYLATYTLVAIFGQDAKLTSEQTQGVVMDCKGYRALCCTL